MEGTSFLFAGRTWYPLWGCIASALDLRGVCSTGRLCFSWSSPGYLFCWSSRIRARIPGWLFLLILISGWSFESMCEGGFWPLGGEQAKVRFLRFFVMCYKTLGSEPLVLPWMRRLVQVFVPLEYLGAPGSCSWGYLTFYRYKYGTKWNSFTYMVVWGFCVSCVFGDLCLSTWLSF